MTNIAEILKNAPKGLKLYSIIDCEVEFNSACNPGEYPIDVRSGKYVEFFDKYGRYFNKYGECVLFPSSEHRDWKDWQKVLIPQCVGSVIVLFDYDSDYEWIVTKKGMFAMNMNEDKTYLHSFNEMCYDNLRFATPKETEVFFERLNKLGYKFEDGEVVKKEKEWSIFDAKDGDFVYDMYNETIFIFKEINSQKALMEYVSYPTPVDFLVQMKSNGNHHSTLGNYYDEKKYRLATIEEVQLLLCKLNDAGYRWNADKKVVEIVGAKGDENSEKKFTIEDFKPFDKVLVRDERSGSNWCHWIINQFSYYVGASAYPYKCLTGDFAQCVPYNEETAYLLGTTENYNGPYKTWED